MNKEFELGCLYYQQNESEICLWKTDGIKYFSSFDIQPGEWMIYLGMVHPTNGRESYNWLTVHGIGCAAVCDTAGNNDYIWNRIVSYG